MTRVSLENISTTDQISVAHATPMERETALAVGKKDARMEESIIALLQNINAALPNQKSKVIQFISSRAGEGTSRVVRRFARMLSEQLNQSVLLLDSDRNHPTHAAALKVKPKFSWDNVVNNGTPAFDAFDQVSGTRLHIGHLIQGHQPRLQVLEPGQISSFFNDLRNHFDYILIDSAPMNKSQESLTVTRSVDGVILVVEAESTRYQVVEKTVDLIRKNDANILGVVLNKRRYPIPKFIYRWL
jgi:Mrp family chromosome partitioning ATPase